MKRFFIRLVSRPWRAAVRWYLRRPRSYSFNGVSIIVLPGVFHPGFFFSTKFLLQFLSNQRLEGKHFLELGCGSGIIATTGAKLGAIVTASDINTIAVRNAQINGELNQIHMTVTHSDLFSAIPVGAFDWIVINPPYYPADPDREETYAWYCGRNHEYFTRLFDGLKAYMHDRSQVLMVLSDVCDMSLIFALADKGGFYFEKIKERKVWTDGMNYLYWIKAKP